MAEKLQLPNRAQQLEPLLALCDNPTAEQAAKMLSRWGLTPEAFRAEVQAKLDRLKKDPVEQLIARSQDSRASVQDQGANTQSPDPANK